EQPILEHEIADDIDPACAHRAARTDLLLAQVYVEARQADDAERGYRNHQDDDDAEQRDHARIGAIAGVHVVFVRPNPRYRSADIGIGQPALHFHHQRIAAAGLRTDHIPRDGSRRNARVEHDILQIIPIDPGSKHVLDHANDDDTLTERIVDDLAERQL